MALVEQKLKVKCVTKPLFKELRAAGEHIPTSHLSQPRWNAYSGLKRYREMPQDQIREEKPMGPLWFSKHLLRSSSAVLSAFTDVAFLDLRHSHTAVPTLLTRRLEAQGGSCALFETRLLRSAGIHIQVCPCPQPLLVQQWNPLFQHQALTRAYRFAHHGEVLQIKNKKKTGFQSHHLGLKKDVTLTPPNFFTLAGMGLERRNLNQMKTGLYPAEEQGSERLKVTEGATILEGFQEGRVCWEMRLARWAGCRPQAALIRSHSLNSAIWLKITLKPLRPYWAGWKRDG